MELVNLQTEAERAAGGRSRLYQFLELAFAFPDEDLYDAVRDGSFAGAIANLCAALPYDMAGTVTSDLRAVPESYVDFESEYIRLFDVGATLIGAGFSEETRKKIGHVGSFPISKFL